jgi:hypothetical protein
MFISVITGVQFLSHTKAPAGITINFFLKIVPLQTYQESLCRKVMNTEAIFISNHCTLLNSIEWPWQSAGWLETASITNSIFINPYMIGHRALDLLDDDQDYSDMKLD